MRNFRTVFVLLAGSIFFFSCQKELSFSDPSQANNGNNGNNGGTGNNGGNGNNGGGGATANTYFPMTPGSKWKYKDSLTGTTTENISTSGSKTINNILFTEIKTTMAGQVSSSWAAAPKPNYYITAAGVSPGGASYDIMFHYLNDTASVGYNWEYTAGQGNGFTAIIKTTIIAKGLTMTVAGKTYNDVIQTRLDLFYDLMGMQMDFGNYNYFIAKGVGVIKVRSDIGMMGVSVLQSCSDLIDYEIK